MAAATAGLLAVAAPAGAHTGHPAGGALDGLAHPVLGLDHLLVMVAIGVLAALAGSRRLAWRTPLGFVAGMVVGGVAGLAGLAVPGGELLVAATVVAVGLGIVTVARGEARWLPVAAGAMGVLHGLAHGGELPVGATPVAYVAGFVVATAALHAAGTGVGLGLRTRATARVATGALVAGAGLALLLGA